MKKIIAIITLTTLIFVGIIGCQQNVVMDSDQLRNTVPTLPTIPYNYVPDQMPEHFQNALAAKAFSSGSEAINVGQNNNLSDVTLKIDNDVAALGRVLFYDPQLSLTGKVSCASCHRQANGFADNKALSEGFKGAITHRNSMAIVNPVLNNSLFWDSRSPNIRSLVLEPVQNHIEMGMENVDDLRRKLAGVDYYPELFRKAYGSPVVDEEKISTALTQFLSAMVSYNSKYDKGLDNEFANFSAKEQIGKQLFFSEKAQCSGCHNGANFAAPDGSGFAIMTDLDGNFIESEEFATFGDPRANPYRESQGTANIGLDVDYADNGRGNGTFKIPSLRNIGLTAPYMHDGRYESLADVVDHYNKNIQPHKDLDAKFKTSDGLPQQLGLTDIEQESLVAFLHTLTDASFVTDERFSDPFLK